jgi:hypothetical protein
MLKLIIVFIGGLVIGLAWGLGIASMLHVPCRNSGKMQRPEPWPAPPAKEE